MSSGNNDKGKGDGNCWGNSDSKRDGRGEGEVKGGGKGGGKGEGDGIQAAAFDEVDWEHLDLAMSSKSDMYKIWRSK